MTAVPYIGTITIDDLTPREIAVASLIARCWTTKQIAAELGITPHRVLCLLAAVARKSGCAPGCEDKVHVALWYQSQFPVYVPDRASPIRTLPEIQRAS